MMRIAKNIQILLILLLACGLAGCATQQNVQVSNAPKITVYMTVDWEGATLDDDNLQAMRDFRAKYPHIAMLQFLNPAYFLKSGASDSEVYQKINATLMPNDEHGLHIHAWKSLTNQCDVPFKAAPKYADNEPPCHTADCGYTVSLEYAYSQKELSQLLECSANILVSQGFRRPTSFRAGGWQLGPKLTAALQQTGFRLDSSRIDAQLLTTRWNQNSPIIQMLKSLHAGSSPLDQPYDLSDTLRELPNNAALADYTNDTQLVQMFKTLIANHKQVMVLGFHQETAVLYLTHLDEAIPQMEQLAKKAGVKLEWAQYRH